MTITTSFLQAKAPKALASGTAVPHLEKRRKRNTVSGLTALPLGRSAGRRASVLMSIGDRCRDLINRFLHLQQLENE